MLKYECHTNVLPVSYARFAGHTRFAGAQNIRYFN